MQCQEVKHRLNNKLELTEECIEHIKHCESCSRGSHPYCVLLRRLKGLISCIGPTEL